MHRLTMLFVALALIVAGCGDDDDSPTSTTSIGAAEATTTTASGDGGTTSPDTAPDATTVITDTTTDGDTSTTVVDPPEGAPTTVLDSFTATSQVIVNVGDNPITVTTEGTRVGEAFECTATVDLAETHLVTSTIVTLDGAWIDEGDGYQEADIDTLTDIVSSCPLHPVFWAEFDTSLCPTDMTGTAETVNGIATQRVDFSASAELATCLRFAADLEGADFGGLPEEGATAELSMEVEIADANDPGLVVEPPES